MKVDRYIVLSDYAKDVFTRGGLPASKIVVKPNFLLNDPGAGAGDGGYALFVGRLSEEKGIKALLDAWMHVGPRLRLRLVGDGPMAEATRKRVADMPSVDLMGWRDAEDVAALMRRATVLLVPSLWAETFGLVVIEAYAAGTPVLCSRIGALEELVHEGQTGLLFEAGDDHDLAAKALWFVDHEVDARRMRTQARLAFESRYSANANYAQLLRVYEDALGARA